MSSGVFIGDKKRRQIVALLKTGRKQSRIAAEVGVSESTVSRINVALHGPGATPDQRTLIHVLLEAGVPVDTIARRAGVSNTTVRRAKGRCGGTYARSKSRRGWRGKRTDTDIQGSPNPKTKRKYDGDVNACRRISTAR